MDIRPLRTEADYRAALAEVWRLWDAPEGTDDADTLEVLSTLVEAYEKRHYPIPPPDPIDYLHFCMEDRGVTRQRLAQIIGGRGRLSEILNRKRPLTVRMMRRLREQLGVPADVLLQPYELRAPRGETAKPKAALAS
jgi:HTH-type transcriptional regulator / antitoxin HigA